jgi:hypothetical protein
MRGVAVHRKPRPADAVIERAKVEILQALRDAGRLGSWGGDLKEAVLSATITDAVYAKARTLQPGGADHDDRAAHDVDGRGARGLGKVGGVSANYPPADATREQVRCFVESRDPMRDRDLCGCGHVRSQHDALGACEGLDVPPCRCRLFRDVTRVLGGFS